MKTKWASCSRKNKITFNFMLKYLPPRLIRYTTFHEMAHLLIPNHNKDFWFLIKREFKNYPHFEEELFGYWFLLQNKKLKDPKKMGIFGGSTSKKLIDENYGFSRN
jgi:predicted metal-dependent hydrolase